MNIRYWVLVSHRWLGLASSAVVSIVGATGAVLVWPGTNLLHRAAGRFHQELAIGPVGWWVVVVATLCAVVLELGGIILWWRKFVFSVRLRAGWKQALTDLHYSIGALGLLLMLLLAVTGIGMVVVTPQNQPALRRIVFDLHTSRGFPTAIKVLYAVASVGFLTQGVSGVIMWWKPGRKARPSRT